MLMALYGGYNTQIQSDIRLLSLFFAERGKIKMGQPAYSDILISELRTLIIHPSLLSYLCSLSHYSYGKCVSNFT
jgi:hypothetical protein